MLEAAAEADGLAMQDVGVGGLRAEEEKGEKAEPRRAAERMGFHEKS